MKVKIYGTSTTAMVDGCSHMVNEYIVDSKYIRLAILDGSYYVIDDKAKIPIDKREYDQLVEILYEADEKEDFEVLPAETETTETENNVDGLEVE